jgi:hypothetical protein
MSDGPHRSLRMRTAWKKLAERADMPNRPPAEVEEAVCPALAADWRNEISDRLLPELRSALGIESTGMLFPDQMERDLDALRSKATSPLAGLVIDHTRQALAEGLRGEAALNFAILSALQERALCGLRQVGEHYHRRVNQERTENVTRRLSVAIESASIARPARDLLGGQSSPISRAPAKRVGLDEGVPL